jgi:hypothetical protein
MRPVLVVMGLVLAQDLPQMSLIPDEGAVQDLAAASADPTRTDRDRWCLGRRECLCIWAISC